jgi:hypothetical protein
MSERAQPAEFRPSRNLRLGFVLMTLIMLGLWGASLIPVIDAWGNPNEDGFSFVPVFWATLTCLPIGAATLIGAIAGSGRSAARAQVAFFMGVAVIVIVSLLGGAMLYFQLTDS